MMDHLQGRTDSTELNKTVTWVNALAHSLVHDSNRAEDLAQDAWLAMLRGQTADAIPRKAWFQTVLRNFAYKGLRSDASRSQSEQERESAPQTPSPDQLLERTERQCLLVEAVTRLEEPYRSTVLLRYADGLDAAEIGRRQGLPHATVRTRLKRGLEQLRASLDREFGGDRRAWSLALMPLWQGVGRAPLPGGLANWWTTPKLVLAAAALGIALIPLALARMGDGQRNPLPLLEHTQINTQVWPESGTLQTDKTASPLGSQTALGTNQRLPLNPGAEIAQPAPAVSEQPQPTGAWYLQGTFPGLSIQELEGVTLQVYANLLWPPKVRSSLQGGGGRIDLSSLFGQDNTPVRSLMIRVEHESFSPATLSIDISREKRLQGWTHPNGVTFEFSAKLKPAFAKISGNVNAPSEIDPTSIHVALIAFDAQLEPVEEAIIRGQCDSTGHFDLCLPNAGRFALVASSDSGLRPELSWIEAFDAGATLSQDLNLDYGETIEGIVLASGLPLASMKVQARPDARAGKHIDGLIWTGGRFERNAATAHTDRQGNFSLSGLAKSTYRVSVLGARLENHPMGRVLGHGPAGYYFTLGNAPSRGLLLELEAEFIRFLAAGQPVGDVDWYKQPGRDTQTGERWGAELSKTPSDRLVTLHVSSDTRFIFSKPGYSPREGSLKSFPLDEDGWRRVELQPKATSSLRLVIEGDPGWSADFFSLRIRPLEESDEPGAKRRFAQQSSEEDVAPVVLRRVANGIQIEDLNAGSYEIDITPCASNGLESIDAWLLATSLQLDLESGSNTRTLNFEHGGRIQVPPSQKWPYSLQPRCILLADDQDRMVSFYGISLEFKNGRRDDPIGSLSNTSGIHASRQMTLFRTLPVGTYRVYVWTEDVDLQPDTKPSWWIPVTIQAGEPSMLDWNMAQPVGNTHWSYSDHPDAEGGQ